MLAHTHTHTHTHTHIYIYIQRPQLYNTTPSRFRTPQNPALQALATCQTLRNRTVASHLRAVSAESLYGLQQLYIT
jgi:hypothetical protein